MLGFSRCLINHRLERRCACSSSWNRYWNYRANPEAPGWIGEWQSDGRSFETCFKLTRQNVAEKNIKDMIIKEVKNNMISVTWKKHQYIPICQSARGWHLRAIRKEKKRTRLKYSLKTILISLYPGTNLSMSIASENTYWQYGIVHKLYVRAVNQLKRHITIR